MLKRLIPLMLALMLCLTAAAEEAGILNPVETEQPAAAESTEQPAEETAEAEPVFDPFAYTVTMETQDENTLVLSFVGDCTVGEQYTKRGYQSGYTYKIRKAGFAYPFSAVADMFAADDLTLANCEGSFTNAKPTKKIMALSAPEAFAEVFTLGNVDAVNTLNNHTKDFGTRGPVDTKAALDKYGIAHFGKNETYVTEIKGIRIGIFSLCIAIKKDQINYMHETIERLRNEENCDFIILSVHWGKEEKYVPTGDQLKAEDWLDAGIDLIWGHGSHTLQPISYVKDKLIFYSTGNFTFGANGSPKDPYTAVLQVQLTINEDKTLTLKSLTAIPCWQNKDRDFRPYPIESQEQRTKCLKKLVATSKQRVKSNLPDSFLTTGYVDFTAWRQELQQGN